MRQPSSVHQTNTDLDSTSNAWDGFEEPILIRASCKATLKTPHLVSASTIEREYDVGPGKTPQILFSFSDISNLHQVVVVGRGRCNTAASIVWELNASEATASQMKTASDDHKHTYLPSEAGTLPARRMTRSAASIYR